VSEPAAPAAPRPAPSTSSSPWRWIPSLYFAQGLPFVAVTALSVVMYKNLGVGNAEIALVTSWLYLPWVIKPLWGPLVELLGAKRRWIVALQFGLGAALASLALAVPAPAFLQWTLALFWLIAFASATHDIAADGFYLLALPQAQQAAFVGVRSTCFRLANIAGQGGLVVLAGRLQEATGTPAAAWATVFGLLGGLFLLLALHHAWALPRPALDRAAPRPGDALALVRGFGVVWGAFFSRPDILRVLAFLLLYRFAEAQMLRLIVPFLLDPQEAGGLAMSTTQVGIVYGTVGAVALTAGGLLGGWWISRRGLGRLWWTLVAVMHLPNLVYVGLAVAQPPGLWLPAAAVAVEQFGYGLGFTAYMVYLMMVAGQGEHKTAHYALGTGFMALGMMLPGMAAGWLQQQMGYSAFFIWACVATLPSIAAAAFVRPPLDFGRADAGSDAEAGAETGRH